MDVSDCHGPSRGKAPGSGNRGLCFVVLAGFHPQGFLCACYREDECHLGRNAYTRQCLQGPNSNFKLRYYLKDVDRVYVHGAASRKDILVHEILQIASPQD